MSGMYIAMAVEVKPHGSKKGECQEIKSWYQLEIALNDSILKNHSIEVFFTVYAVNSKGEVTAIEDFRSLGEALENWSDVQVCLPETKKEAA